MNEYEKLLENVSDKYHIYRGAKEPENDWKARVIYSICGMMAYTSLWDDEKSISIVHLKRRVRRILKDYLSLYPSVSMNSLLSPLMRRPRKSVRIQRQLKMRLQTSS